jgi:hypothetical protein
LSSADKASTFANSSPAVCPEIESTFKVFNLSYTLSTLLSRISNNSSTVNPKVFAKSSKSLEIYFNACSGPLSPFKAS